MRTCKMTKKKKNEKEKQQPKKTVLLSLLKLYHYQHSEMNIAELQIRGIIDDNSKIIFLISQ